MIALFSLVFFLNFGSDKSPTENCSCDAKCVDILVRRLHSDSILEGELDTFFINANPGVLDESADHSLRVEGKELLISYSPSQRTDLFLSSKEKRKDGNLAIGFEVFRSTVKYTGIFTFRCSENGLLFNNIHYISSID